MDKELMTMLGVAIGGIILLVVLANLLKNHRIVRVIVMAIIIIGVFFSVGKYIYNNEMMFSNNATYYVYGQVNFVSSSTAQARMVSVRSNFGDGGKGYLNFKTTPKTKIVDETDNDKVVKLSEINEGDTVQVYCSEKLLPQDEKPITAIKVVVKARR